MLQKESKLFINTSKGILYTTLLALTTIGGVYAADPVNICPQQKVEVNKTYYNIEGNCNSTGEVYKYIGTTLSSDVFGSVIVESTPRNTELLTLFKPESVNGDYYEAGKYSVKLTCKKNEVSSTNSFDIDLKNYWDADPNFSGKKCVVNTLKNKISDISYKPKGDTSTANNNYGNKFVLYDKDGTLDKLDVRCRNGADNSNNWNTNMNHDNGGIRYNDGGVFQTDSSCKIFVPKAEIEQVSGVLNDINFNCEQSNRYKLYFVENKRISEMNSGDWNGKVVKSSDNIDTTFDAKNDAGAATEFVFYGAYTVGNKKGSVKLECIKDTTAVATGSTTAKILSWPPRSPVTANIECNNVTRKLTLKCSGDNNLKYKLLSTTALIINETNYPGNTVNYPSTGQYDNNTKYSLVCNDNEETATSTIYVNSDGVCSSEAKSCTGGKEFINGSCECPSGTTLNINNDTCTSNTKICKVKMTPTGYNDDKNASPAWGELSSGGDYAFDFELKDTEGCACKVTYKNNHISLSNNKINDSLTASSTEQSWSFSATTTGGSVGGSVCKLDTNKKVNEALSASNITLTANPSTIYLSGANTKLTAVISNAMSKSCDIKGGQWANWKNILTSSPTSYSPWSETTQKITNPTAYTVRCYDILNKSTTTKQVKVNIFSRGEV